MKTKYATLAIAALSMLCSSSVAANRLQVIGNIEGLQPQDTLYFIRISMPTWQDVSTDTLVVSEPGKFTYQTPLAETGYFIITHKPAVGESLPTHSRGIVLYGRPGDKLEVDGKIEFFTLLQPKGGMYDDARIEPLRQLEDSVIKADEHTFRKIIHFDKLKDTPEAKPDSMEYYITKFNTRSCPALNRERKRIAETIDDNEYAAIIYLQRLHDTSYPDFKERFARFTPQIKATATGKLLEQMLQVKANIEPGNVPSPFTVTATDGKQVSLSDYRGKYLLIYHWGICPGTIWVQPRLLELYKEYHAKGFEVLGFTQGALSEDMKQHDELAPLFEQPWTTVYTSAAGNEFITDDYYFAGVPILMVISPEGKTIYRGYNEVFELLQKLLQEKLAAQ